MQITDTEYLITAHCLLYTAINLLHCAIFMAVIHKHPVAEL